jgi:Amt family ammonium transporter
MLATLEGTAWGMPAARVVSLALAVAGLVLLHGGGLTPGRLKATLVRLSVIVALVTAQWLLLGRWVAFGVGSGLHPTAGANAAMAGLVLAVVVGTLGDRLSLAGCAVFVVAWSTVVFDPLVRWFDRGWLAQLGVLDASGALPLHLAAGISALVFAHVAGRRVAATGGPGDPWRGVVGAILLAFGCAGLAVAASKGPEQQEAALASLVLGATGATLGRLVVGWCEEGSATLSGAPSAAVAGVVAISVGAGLVSPSAALAIGWIAGAVATGTSFGFIAGSLGSLLAITAAAGYVAPATAIAIGCYVATLCYFTVWLKRRLPSGPGSEVFAVHALGGLLGAVLAGVFAQQTSGSVGGALFGHVGQLGTQLAGCAVVAAYSGAATRLLSTVILQGQGSRGSPRHGALASTDLAGEPRAVRSSGVFQSRRFDSERMAVESLLESSAGDSASVLKT